MSGFFADRLPGMGSKPQQLTRAGGNSGGGLESPGGSSWGMQGMPFMGAPSSGSGFKPKPLDWSNFTSEDFDDDLLDEENTAETNVKKNLSQDIDYLASRIQPIEFSAPREERKSSSTFRTELLVPAPLYMETATTFVSSMSIRQTIGALEVELEKSAQQKMIEFSLELEKKKTNCGHYSIPQPRNFRHTTLSIPKSQRNGSIPSPQ